jgi:hypothetical protein
MSDVLPPAFRHLESFVADWDLPSSNDRYRQRLAQPLESMQRFNDAIVASADAIKTHLDAKPFEAYDAGDRRLVNLMLSFTVVAQAVQIYRRPAVPDSGSVPMFDFALEPWNG